MAGNFVYNHGISSQKMDVEKEKEKWSTLEEIKKKSATLSKMTMDELVETIKKYPQVLELNKIIFEESIGKKKSRKEKPKINLNDVSNLFYIVIDRYFFSFLRKFILIVKFIFYIEFFRFF